MVEFTAKTLNAMKLQYDFELSNEFINELEEQNIVIVFGRGKDCVSFLGAIEADYEDRDNVVIKNNNIEIIHYQNQWNFNTHIPHKKFYIWDDTQWFCEGIVFSLDDLE